MKISNVTVEPATLRLVAQCLNQMRHRQFPLVLVLVLECFKPLFGIVAHSNTLLCSKDFKVALSVADRQAPNSSSGYFTLRA